MYLHAARLRMALARQRFDQFALAVAGHARDADDLDEYPKAILVIGAGDVTMVGMKAVDSTGVLFPAVPAYSLLPCRPRKIFATGTTSAPRAVYADSSRSRCDGSEARPSV